MRGEKRRRAQKSECSRRRLARLPSPSRRVSRFRPAAETLAPPRLMALIRVTAGTLTDFPHRGRIKRSDCLITLKRSTLKPIPRTEIVSYFSRTFHSTVRAYKLVSCFPINSPFRVLLHLEESFSLFRFIAWIQRVRVLYFSRRCSFSS